MEQQHQLDRFKSFLESMLTSVEYHAILINFNLLLFFYSHYKLLYTIFALGLPTIVPIYFWNEDPWMALWVGYFARTIINLNVTWLVNSAAHLYGTRPFDK